MYNSKKCPKHGLHFPCDECIDEGVSLCIHCGKDLTNLSINECLKHFELHREILDERSKELLNVLKDFHDEIDIFESINLKGDSNTTNRD